MMENRALAFVFFCGFISICGITIPGLSGSFILILLGNYELLLVDAVNSFFDLIANIFKNENYPIESELIKILIVFFLGSVIGLIILSKFLSFIKKISNSPKSSYNRICFRDTSNCLAME